MSTQTFEAAWQDFYLTEEQFEEMFKTIKQFRKGHKLHKHGHRYSVKVDGEYHSFKTVTTLRSFLNDCLIKECRVFRNMDKGITIDITS